MDNMEENSRSTEQDRVANPVEETVSTTVEPALSENKRERKKREKAEKKKNAPAQGNSLLGSTLAKIMAFVLMIAAAIAGVLGLYGTCMLARVSITPSLTRIRRRSPASTWVTERIFFPSVSST